jgi:two-component sensor histidine kinase
MNHRVKNLFALAISVLSLSGRSATNVRELIESARDRLSALSRAHALTLSHSRKDGPPVEGPTTLHSLVQAITAPHEESGEARVPRFSIIGCDMEISGQVISGLALLLHEFATNSTKYGALSTDTGQVQIHCADRGETVVITWTEREGPAVAPPTDDGFGAVLIRATIEGQLGGEISQDWKPEGLVVRLVVPRARLTG